MDGDGNDCCGDGDDTETSSRDKGGNGDESCGDGRDSGMGTNICPHAALYNVKKGLLYYFKPLNVQYAAMIITHRRMI